MIPTAQDMADSIWAVTQRMLDAEILEESSRSAALKVKGSLLRQPKGQKWNISVPREEGFVFTARQSSSGVLYTPVVSVGGIATDPSCAHQFSQLDIALQISCVDDERHARWHFDLANLQNDGIYQAGPLFHMQFGGNSPGYPGFWLDVPRWAHAPMDLVLLLEAVAANFYPDEWATHLREDPGWCEHVTQSERLCLTGYLQKMSHALSVSSKTVLGSLWANP